MQVGRSTFLLMLFLIFMALVASTSGEIKGEVKGDGKEVDIEVTVEGEMVVGKEGVMEEI